MNGDKILSDMIFGFIQLKPHIVAIIDTPEFQRLRWIWQLGLTAFVYPTADHTRFEHSIGTYWLASRIVKKLQEQLKVENAIINISDKDVMCVEIAALCHDIGHGPFSHFWDNLVIPKFCQTENNHSHESQFCNIWNIIKKNPSVDSMLKKCSLNEVDERLINDLVMGNIVPGKEILCGIVNNSESGIDVDKWDYLARDSTYLGHASTNYRSDIDRMMHLARAIEDKDGKWKIAFRETESLNILRVFQLKLHMLQTACRHRTVIAMEHMMLDGIGRCLELNIFSIKEISDTQWITENTDGIFWTNVKIIPEFKRILCRDLYMPIFEAVKYEIVLDPNKKLLEYLKHNNVSTTNIRFAFIQFKFTNNNGNPLCQIPFYRRHEKTTLFRYSEDNLPLNLQMNGDESRVFVFITTKNNDNDILSFLKTFFTEDNWNVVNYP